MKTFIFKDVSKKIPVWPFHGEVIAAAIFDNILEADAWFAKMYPQYINKGKVSSTITITIENHGQN